VGGLLQQAAFSFLSGAIENGSPEWESGAAHAGGFLTFAGDHSTTGGVS